MEQSPILFIVFNRPECTKKAFDTIRKAKPTKLFVAADGPGKNQPKDIDLCNRTREIVKNVDWDCDVKYKFAEQNSGCKRNVIDGIHWAFEKETKLIILEDDCLAEHTFFPFCDNLLDRYENDKRIMSIAGSNFLWQHKRRNSDSYFFSYFPQIWGWATWKRAWSLYDEDATIWPSFRDDNWLFDLFGNLQMAKIWKNIINASHKNKDFDTWDHQWAFSCLNQSGFCIIPSVNLISNIGHGPGSTHSTNRQSSVANLPTQPVSFPLIHPTSTIRDFQMEKKLCKYLVSPLSIRIRDKFKKLLINKIL